MICLKLKVVYLGDIEYIYESYSENYYYKSNILSDRMEYFPLINSSFYQPKSNEAIFFVDASFSTNGLLDISSRFIIKSIYF